MVTGGQFVTVVGSGAAWTPASLSSLAVWYDPTAAGVSIDVGVETLIDQSSNSDDLSQATDANQPAWSATTFGAGKPGFTTDGTNDNLRGAFTTGGILSAPYTIAVAYNVDASDWALNEFLFDGDDATNRAAIYRSGSNLTMYAGSNLSLTAIGNAEGTHVLVCEFNGASSKAWLDGGSSLGNGDAGSAAPDGMTLGANQSGGSNYLPADFGGVVVVDAALSTADLNSLGGYLAAKVGSSWSTVS